MKNILNNKKVIIFDLDGVLINSVDFLRNYMKNKYEGMTDEDFKEIFLVNFWDGLNNFKKIAEKKYLIHHEVSKDNRASNNEIFLYKGVDKLVRDLAKKYILVINSSDNEKFIIERLQHNNIIDFFDFVAGKETSLSKIEKFNFILKKYNVTNEEVVFVTDTVGDVVESEKMNIDYLAVTWGVHSEVDFKKRNFKNMTVLNKVSDFYLLL